MRIRHLSIRNFRGIRDLDWALRDRRVHCLVGRGDSTKTTILEAIRRVFHPQWNLVFYDSDFFECKPANKVLIEVTLGELPDEFRDLARYGYHISGWNSQTQKREDDPSDRIEEALRIRLSVGEDLEPAWRVIKGDDDEGVPFKVTDRVKVGVSLIGDASDRDLTWSRGSLLSRLTEGDGIPASLAEAARAAKGALNQQRQQALAKFDAVAAKAEAAAKALGVPVAHAYKADLDSDGINIRLGGLAIHDGDVPLRQLGLGSKRMLTTGLQKEGREGPHITLVDEVELGLEPYRISRLLAHLNQDNAGQYVMTTHSPVVLRELSIADLHVVHSRQGRTSVLAADQPNLAEAFQGTVRLHAEALLASRVIVCEGATEVGFIRGLDQYWISKGKRPLAYQGVSLLDAKGDTKVRGIAEDLTKLSYHVAVVADSDSQGFAASDATALRELGVAVTLWSDSFCIERRVFADVPWEAVRASVALAFDIYGATRVIDQVSTQFGQGFERDPARWADDAALRTAIGKAAKTGDWFKNIAKGQRWAVEVSAFLDDATMEGKDLTAKLADARQWIDRA